MDAGIIHDGAPCKVVARPSAMTSSRDVLCHFWADITIKPSYLRARTSSRLDGFLCTGARWYISSAVQVPRRDYMVISSQYRESAAWCCGFWLVSCRRLSFSFHYLILTLLLYGTYCTSLLLFKPQTWMKVIRPSSSPPLNSSRLAVSLRYFLS